MLDVNRIRKDFPILSRTIYGKPLVYLDNAATSQKPTSVIQSLVDYYESYNWLGIVLSNRNELKEAEKNFMKGISINNNNFIAYKNIIIKGKWRRSIVKNYANYGLDLKDLSRPIMTLRDEFEKNLIGLCQDLAKDLVRDGEGVTKLIELKISGADSPQMAQKIGKSIINSPLIKTAVHGADPNWGRFVMAVGKVFEHPVRPVSYTHLTLPTKA